MTAPSLCHGDTEGPAFRGCSRLCTIVGGRGQVSSGIVVQVHHSTASRGPGRCWVSPTHTRKEARSSPNETALGRQWIAKARQCPRKKGPFPELSLTLSSCSLPWTRRETVPSIGSAGYLSQAHITSKDNLPRAAESLRLISALLIASTPYLQGAGPGAPFKTLSVPIH